MAAIGTPPCSVCGAVSRPGSRFCGECGAPVGAAVSAPHMPATKRGEHTQATQTGLTQVPSTPAGFTGQAPQVDAGRYSKVSRSLATTRAGGVGPAAPGLVAAGAAPLPSGSTAEAAAEPPQQGADATEPSEAAKGRPKRRRDRTIPGMDVEEPAKSLGAPPAPPAPPARPAPVAPLARAADPQAPTDPALVLGLGPAGAPLPPIDVPAPSDDEDDDDRPTRMRASSPALTAIGGAAKPQGFGPQAHATAVAAQASVQAASSAGSAGASDGSKTEFQRLLEEVETGFDSILDDSAASNGPAIGRATSEFDATEVRTLFDQIAVAHARPIRDFMVEIKLGEPPRSWIGFCRPAVRALERSARGMDLLPLAEALDSFMTALELAEDQSESLIREQARQMLIDAYSDLIARMPQAFALETESNRREGVIVHALLAQVPGLHALGRDRLYEAGMTSLALYFVAKAKDLVETARLEPRVAERVVERFVGYRREASDLLPDDGRAIELSRLEALADILERTAASYEEASASWGAGSGVWRKELRRARSDASAQVRLLLARLGELDLCTATDSLPTAAKVAALRAFIADARRSWKPVPESIRRLE